MKRFFYIIAIYLFASIIATEMITNSDISRLIKVQGHEIRTAERKSKRHTTKKVKKLILGDSTGCGLYPSWRSYNSIVSLACNQAISMAGQYFLLKNFLEANNDNLPQEVVLLCNPGSFSNDMDQFAYHYFLKPFPMWRYKKLYTSHLSDRVESIPLYWTAYFPFVHASRFTPKQSVPEVWEVKDFSKISYEYLLLIDSLTQSYNIPLHFIATPVREDRSNQWKKVAKNIESTCPEQLKCLFEQYNNSITYYPSDYFTDNAHLKKQHIPHDYLGILD